MNTRELNNPQIRTFVSDNQTNHNAMLVFVATLNMVKDYLEAATSVDNSGGDYHEFCSCCKHYNCTQDCELSNTLEDIKFLNKEFPTK